MWEPTDKWGPPRTSGSQPIGVHRVGAENELGLAKQRGKQQEKLASDLAALVGVRVPRVELDTIKDKSDAAYAISRVHGRESTDLTAVRQKAADEFKSAPVQDAIKRASGLVPFYAWVGTGDQKDDHLVLDRDADGSYHVTGVDFKSSFGWGEPDGGQVGRPGVPQALAENNNIVKGIVAEAVDRIEAVTDEQIFSAVKPLPISEENKKRIADGLIGRRGSVRARMKEQGWLD